jgi:oxygen-independent coproporphyrinogen III oxidase
VTAPAHWRDLGPGIYLHVPFCRRRCAYCDFASTIGDAAARARFVHDLHAEIRLVVEAGEFAGETFRTVYFGGGTPSLLEGGEAAGILRALRASFDVAPDAEITLEANPESLAPERLDAILQAGANRVSLGVQSLDDAALRLLGRAHDAGVARQRCADLRQRRVPFSVDLIYGLPGLDAAAWGAALDAAFALGADHLSAYLLTLEEGTPMHTAASAGEITLPGGDEAREQYDLLVDRAAAAGLSCYEISNFARPGSASRHNQNYWVRGEYLGLGPSAHSHRGGLRWANATDLGDWTRAVGAGVRPIESREAVSPRQAAEEWIFLGLRRTEGVPWKLLAEAAGPTVRPLERAVDHLARQGVLEREQGWLRLAPAARFISDAIFAHLMGSMDGVRPAEGGRG